MDPSEEARDLRQFLREQTERNDRAWRALRADLRAGRATLEALVRESAKCGHELDVAIDELHAHRGALFQILDRLPEPGG
jgi:hypothetical protein